jgi:hypothetical protein
VSLFTLPQGSFLLPQLTILKTIGLFLDKDCVHLPEHDDIVGRLIDYNHDYRNVLDVANRYFLLYDGGIKPIDQDDLVQRGYLTKSATEY